MMKGAGSTGYDEIKRLNAERDVHGEVSSGLGSSEIVERGVRGRLVRSVTPDPIEGYLDWHSIVGDDDLEDNPNT